MKISEIQIFKFVDIKTIYFHFLIKKIRDKNLSQIQIYNTRKYSYLRGWKKKFF